MPKITTNHPADLAEQLAALPPKERNLSFLRLSGDQKSEVFPHFDLAEQEEILASLGDKGMRELFENLAPDDRTQLSDDFPDDLIRRTINYLKPVDRKDALALLGYEPDSIGRIMTPHYIKARPD